MKCPLVWYQDYDKGIPSGFRYGDCLKGECAWWDKKEKVCAVFSAKCWLAGIAMSLADIQGKIPQTRQTY